MLDVARLECGFGNICVGYLTGEVIGLLKLNQNPCKIILWEDRYKYIKKHLPDFTSAESFHKSVAMIPEIIEHPDYIGLHPSKDSIEFIKTVDERVLVAVRLRSKGDLFVRTVFPLTDDQFGDYLASGTIVNFKKQLTK